MNFPSAAGIPSAGTRLAGGIRFHARDLGLFALVLLGLSMPFWLATSPDYFWHLKTGELIVKSGHPPTHDVFSFTVPGKSWLDHEWLSQVALYGLHQSVGYAGSVVAFACVGLLSIAVLFVLLRRLGIPELATLTLCYAATILSLPFWIVRPATFSILLTVIFLAATYLYRREKITNLWYLPLLMVLWANLHGGYVVGLGLLGLLVVSELVQRNFSRAKHATLVLLLTFLAAGINPYTYRLWIYPFTYFLGDNSSLAVISEWQSPTFFHGFANLPLAFVLLALVALGCGRRFDFWRLGLALGFTALALQSVRHGADFALVLPVVAAEMIVERWPNLDSPRRPVASSTSTVHLATAGLLATLAVLVVLLRGFQTGHEPRTDLARLSFPVAGAAFIAENYPNARMFNEYAWGGYLIEASPEQKVFIDGRADLYGKAVLARYQRARLLHYDWAQVLDQYDIDLVIFEKDSPLASALRMDRAWREVFVGPVESVFVRPPRATSTYKKLRPRPSVAEGNAEYPDGTRNSGRAPAAQTAIALGHGGTA